MEIADKSPESEFELDTELVILCFRWLEIEMWSTYRDHECLYYKTGRSGLRCSGLKARQAVSRSPKSVYDLKPVLSAGTES